MATRIVLAVAQREYAAKLAAYLREEEPDWEVAAFTGAVSLKAELASRRGIDLLVAQRGMTEDSEQSPGRVRRTIDLVESMAEAEEGENALLQYQPLPALLDGIRNGLCEAALRKGSECKIVTVFSASGGAGKTTVALNLVRQAGERGWRAFYLNAESLNATSVLFGRGEPDSLSRLLYVLHDPERWTEEFAKLCRHLPQLRADYLDAPDHPGERLALTADKLRELAERIRGTGKYDLIVIDPDSGSGEWHRELLGFSDVSLWLTADDALDAAKTDKLLRYWNGREDGWSEGLAFVRNKGRTDAAAGGAASPGRSPIAVLPYVPQWKAVDQPGRLLASPAFCGAMEELLDRLGYETRTSGTRRRREADGHGKHRAHVRGAV